MNYTKEQLREKTERFLKLRGKHELESIKGFTGEYILTVDEMVEFALSLQRMDLKLCTYCIHRYSLCEECITCIRPDKSNWKLK